MFIFIKSDFYSLDPEQFVFGHLLVVNQRSPHVLYLSNSTQTARTVTTALPYSATRYSSWCLHYGESNVVAHYRRQLVGCGIYTDPHQC